MSVSSKVVILGAGHAGGTLAALLRQYKHEGDIVMIGDEPIAPYQRPPLSKAWLKGEADAESLALRPVHYYGDNNITFMPSTKAVSLNRGAKTVTLDNGEVVSYDILVIATGARAMALPVPGADLKGVLSLRTAADAEELKNALKPGKRMAIIGGGYIGLEAAASARALGAEAVVVEREPRLLARSAYHVLSDFLKAYHEARGVTFELAASAAAFEGEDGKVTGVKLTDGRVIPCDIALVGIGAAPNDELARESGIECERGIVVDLDARTSDPSVFSIGDVTHRPMPLYDRMFRPESVPSALEQAKQAACAIVGRPRPPGEAPWNWSDQYDLKLQIAGVPFEVDSVLVRGEPSSGAFAVFHLKGDLIQAVEAINAPAEFLMGRNLILSRKPVDPAKLADLSVSMKEVAA
ncbi:NAD(P)/FAD-dependent oxidoreductase [Phenylobacterium immobile]|uniref:NAD(P)/FAD-dependent oxidoreductase n=1 Tax=Phenylobacterium immobile TaxID=21 RepID=UPI000A90B891|nr:FAD-dependent oxidoreductase [Phenylobacterium immobile]